MRLRVLACLFSGLFSLIVPWTAVYAQQQTAATANPDNPEPLSKALLSNFSQAEHAPALPIALSLQSVSNFIPSLHMARFKASQNPIVCIAGDSVSSLTAGQVAPSELLWTALTTAIRIQNPNKSIKFINLAVPSQTWKTFDGVAASHWPSWYTPQTEPWLGFVQAQHCTTLFLSFGVNDGWNISPHAIDSVFRKIAGWSTVPDLILLTNMDINPSYKELGTAGSLHAASYERTLAENGGAFYQIHNLPEIGLIDIGRFFSEAILGFDPASQYLTRDPAYRNWQSETLSAGTFGGRPGAGYLVTTETAGDLDIRVLFSKSAQDLLAPAASQLLIGLSRGGRQFVSVKDQNGVLVATYVDEDTTSSICDNRVSVTANGKKLFQFEIDVNGSHVALLLQGAPACDLIVPRFAAPFQAFIVVLNNQEAVGTKLTFPSAPAVGTMQSFQPIIRGSECWGTKPFAAGGNGINHLASPCSSLIAQAISSLNFN